MKRKDRGYYTRMGGRSGYVKDGWFTPDDGTRGWPVEWNFTHYANETLHDDYLMRQDTQRFVRKVTRPLWKLFWKILKWFVILIVLAMIISSL